MLGRTNELIWVKNNAYNLALNRGMSNDRNLPGAAAGPLTLSVDTATERRSVAVMLGETVLAERSSGLRESGASSVLKDIDEALRAASRTVRDVELFAAAVGPGSFTGLRAGIATLKALSVTLGKPAAGVPTLHAIAHAARPAEKLWALVPAGRGEVFAQLLSVEPGGPVRELTTPAHLQPARLFERAAAFGGGLTWAGGGAYKYLEQIREEARARGFEWREAEGGGGPAADAWALAAPIETLARSVALLGQERLRRGLASGADDLRPLYVRPSDAELHEQCQAPAG